MHNVNASKKLGELELEQGYEGNRSWHHQFKDSAYVYVGGLHLGLTEGDVVIMFSQFGEIVDVNLVRDKSTGKSKGFAFVCFEDQRSTVLAVDNMNGFQLLGRTLRVDHVEKYKAPKRFDEQDVDEDGDPKLLEYKATGAEGAGYNVCNVVKSQANIAETTRHKVQQATHAVQDEDEVWANAFEQSLEAEKRRLKKEKKREKEKHDKRALKRAKKELKKAKKKARLVKSEVANLKSKREKAKPKSDSSEKDEIKKEGIPKSEHSSSSSSSS